MFFDWKNPPPFFFLRQSLRLAFLFSPPQFPLKKRPAPCPKSYHPHPNSVKLLTCSDFFESTCACTADLSRRSFTKTEALCKGVSPSKFDTVRNLLQINACLLHYSRHFVPSSNPGEEKIKFLMNFLCFKDFKNKKKGLLQNEVHPKSWTQLLRCTFLWKKNKKNSVSTV